MERGFRSLESRDRAALDSWDPAAPVPLEQQVMEEGRGAGGTCGVPHQEIPGFVPPSQAMIPPAWESTGRES